MSHTAGKHSLDRSKPLRWWAVAIVVLLTTTGCGEEDVEAEAEFGSPGEERAEDEAESDRPEDSPSLVGERCDYISDVAELYDNLDAVVNDRSLTEEDVDKEAAEQLRAMEADLALLDVPEGLESGSDLLHKHREELESLAADLSDEAERAHDQAYERAEAEHWDPPPEELSERFQARARVMAAGQEAKVDIEREMSLEFDAIMDEVADLILRLDEDHCAEL